jgi:hypothetical protein
MVNFMHALLDLAHLAERLRQLEEDGERKSAKFKELEEDGERKSAKLKQLEEDGERKSAKLKELEEDGERKSAKLKELEEDGEHKSAKLKQLEYEIRTKSDVRLEYFSVAMPGSDSSRTTRQKSTLKKIYRNVCFVCGSSTGVTVAHLLVASSRINYSSYMRANGYKSDFDCRSNRNYITLCGSKGEEGSCHHEFDTYNLMIVPNAFRSGEYVVRCLRETYGKFSEVNNKVLQLPEDFPTTDLPYTRILVWQTIKCLMEHPHAMNSDESNTIIRTCRLSEKANSIGSTSDSDEDEL